MDKAQVHKLIKRATYDAEAKAVFVAAIAAGLFETHSNFLSNPLLCLMMLITYDSTKEIPGKMHIFYERAYNVLYIEHDRSKSVGYKRSFYCDMAPDDFRRTFSTFCAISYSNNKIAIDQHLALHFAKSSIEFEKLTVKPQDYLNDLVESISILVKEGITLHFLHRSFQEYFTAVFVIDRQLDFVAEIIESSACRDQDETIGMIIEINKDAFEKRYLIDRLEQLIVESEKINPILSPGDAFQLFFLGLNVHVEHDYIGYLVGRGGPEYAMERAPFYALMQICCKHYDISSLTAQLSKFGWSEWCGKNRLLSDEDDPVVTFSNPTNSHLESTPMPVGLSKMLEELKQLHDRLKEEHANRAALFRDITPKLCTTAAVYAAYDRSLIHQTTKATRPIRS